MRLGPMPKGPMSRNRIALVRRPRLEDGAGGADVELAVGAQIGIPEAIGDAHILEREVGAHRGPRDGVDLGGVGDEDLILGVGGDPCRRLPDVPRSAAQHLGQRSGGEARGHARAAAIGSTGAGATRAGAAGAGAARVGAAGAGATRVGAAGAGAARTGGASRGGRADGAHRHRGSAGASSHDGPAGPGGRSGLAGHDRAGAGTDQRGREDEREERSRSLGAVAHGASLGDPDRGVQRRRPTGNRSAHWGRK